MIGRICGRIASVSRPLTQRTLLVQPAFATPILGRKFCKPTDPTLDAEGSDKDFQPVNKVQNEVSGEGADKDKELLAKIDSWVKDAEVLLFMKGSPQMPMCGYSRFVVEVLKFYNIKDYKSVDILKDQDIRRLVKEYSDWPTFPQLYVKGELVGGCDIVTELHKKGELKAVLGQE